MLSPDEVTQITETLEQLPRSVNHRSTPSERRQSILQQKQTDTLPSLSIDAPSARLAWRHVLPLREENRRLRLELEVQRARVQQLTAKYDELKSINEHEVSIIHAGYQQEMVQYQNHLQEMIDELDRLHKAHLCLEQGCQELATNFQPAVEEEVQKRIAAIAHEINTVPAQAPEALQKAIKELERQAKEEGDKYLAETVYLKREARRMMNALEQERQQLATQRQDFYAWQHSMREQAELRQRTLHARLHARWRVASLLTSLGLAALLIVLQFVSLSLLHVLIAVPIAVALSAPIVICALAAFVFTKPITMLNHMFKSAPRVKKAKNR